MISSLDIEGNKYSYQRGIESDQVISHRVWQVGLPTEEQQVDPDAPLLGNLIRNELLNVPIEKWGFFFPCVIAVWRFIEIKRTATLGTLVAGYDNEPYFNGKNAEVFCELFALGDNEEYVSLLEELMYPIADYIKANPSILQRGFLEPGEIPSLPTEKIEALASLILMEIDSAIKDGKLK